MQPIVIARFFSHSTLGQKALPLSTSLKPAHVPGRTVTTSEGRLVPAPLVAVTEQRYGRSLTSPVTTSGDAAPVVAPVDAPNRHVAV